MRGTNAAELILAAVADENGAVGGNQPQSLLQLENCAIPLAGDGGGGVEAGNRGAGY